MVAAGGPPGPRGRHGVLRPQRRHPSTDHRSIQAVLARHRLREAIPAAPGSGLLGSHQHTCHPPQDDEGRRRARVPGATGFVDPARGLHDRRAPLPLRGDCNLRFRAGEVHLLRGVGGAPPLRFCRARRGALRAARIGDRGGWDARGSACHRVRVEPGRRRRPHPAPRSPGLRRRRARGAKTAEVVPKRLEQPAGSLYLVGRPPGVPALDAGPGQHWGQRAVRCFLRTRPAPAERPRPGPCRGPGAPLRCAGPSAPDPRLVAADARKLVPQSGSCSRPSTSCSWAPCSTPGHIPTSSS